MKNHMKTSKFIIYIFLFLSISVYAEKKCKFFVDKTDPFTGKHVLMTKNFIFDMTLFSFKWEMLLQKNGEDYSVGSFLMMKGRQNDNIEKGDSIMIKFSDNTVLILHSSSQITPKYVSISNNEFLSTYESYYPIYIEDFKKFSTTMVTVVRINTGSKGYMHEVKEKDARKIMESAICILNSN